MPPVTEKITIENAKLMGRNFSGKRGEYNAEGQRNFCVLLPTDQANMLAEIGWKIRWLKPRDAEDTPQAFLQVKVHYGKKEPKVVLIKGNTKRLLREKTINILDFAEIDHCDMILRPFNWEVKGEKGVAAYLDQLYATLVVDPLEEKYSDIPDAAIDNLDEDGG